MTGKERKAYSEFVEACAGLECDAEEFDMMAQAHGFQLPDCLE